MAERATETVNEALDWIETSILPSLAEMVDALLQATNDEGRRLYAATHAADVQTIAAQLHRLIRELEQIDSARVVPIRGRTAA